MNYKKRMAIHGLSMAVFMGACLGVRAEENKIEVNAQADSGAPGATQTQSGSNQLQSGDQSFAKDAAQSGLMEVKMGQMAKDMGSSSEVKQFGEKLVKDHTKANEQLMTIASKKGMTLAKDMEHKHNSMMDELRNKKGAEFDKEFARHAVKHHKMDVEKFQKASQNLQDAELKAFAAATLPVLQQHLEAARTMAKNLGVQEDRASLSSGADLDVNGHASDASVRAGSDATGNASLKTESDTARGGIGADVNKGAGASAEGDVKLDTDNKDASIKTDVDVDTDKDDDKTLGVETKRGDNKVLGIENKPGDGKIAGIATEPGDGKTLGLNTDKNDGKILGIGKGNNDAQGSASVDVDTDKDASVSADVDVDTDKNDNKTLGADLDRGRDASVSADVDVDTDENDGKVAGVESREGDGKVLGVPMKKGDGRTLGLNTDKSDGKLLGIFPAPGAKRSQASGDVDVDVDRNDRSVELDANADVDRDSSSAVGGPASGTSGASASGSVSADKANLTAADLPQPVQDTLKRHGGAKDAKKIKSEMKEGKKVYRVEIQNDNSKNTVLHIAEDGTVVKDNSKQ